MQSHSDKESSVGFQAFPKRLALTQVHDTKNVAWMNTENEESWCVRLVTCDESGMKYGILGVWEQKDTKLEAYKAMTKWIVERFGESKATGTDIWQKTIAKKAD